MPKTIRWGILGTGSIASDFANALRLIPDAALTVVASRTSDRAAAFARTSGAARSVVGLEALASSSDVDVVYVATPNVSHRGDAIALLEAGRAVVCEKPFATTGAGARAIVDVARRSGVFCMEAMWMRFVPIMRDLHSLVTSGAIGDVRTVVAQLGMPFARGHRALDGGDGGGVLLDLGVYPVSFAMSLLGRPTNVVARRVLGSGGADEQVSIILDFDGGRQAILGASGRTRTANDATILGTEGMIRVNEPLYCPESLTVTPTSPIGGEPKRAERGRLARVKDANLVRELRAIVRRAKAKTITRRVLGAGYAHEIIEVNRCLRAGEKECATMSLDETIAVAETLDEIRRAWAPTGD
jgi:predicted dehydrogenase